MKKKYVFLAAAILCVSLLAGCGCEHAWVEADCQAPRTCSLCGQTEGEILDHSWVDADCESPKTCAACGATEGEALGHSWQEATCTTPKTCTRCGETTGQVSEHMLTDWAYNGENGMRRECSSCGMEESCTMEAYLQKQLAGRWDAVSRANLSRKSEEDPYWRDIRYYFKDIPYMEISETGSHEMFLTSLATDCSLTFDGFSQVKIPPEEEPCDAYYFILRPEEGSAGLFFYVPREEAVFLMGFIRMERAA